MVKADVRYGRKHRLMAGDIKDMKKANYECPSCGKTKLKRKSYAVFECANCSAKIAGAAYAPTSKR